MDFSQGAAWMRGKLVPVSEAAIGVTDWGLTRSDITYDVVSVWKGAFFRLEDHLARFAASMSAMRLKPPETRGQIRDILQTIAAATGLPDLYVAMVASRGTPSVPGTRDPRQCANHFFAWCVPYVRVIREEVAARGASLYIPTEIVRIPPESVDPTVKNYHWGDFTRGLFTALDRGYDSALLLDREANVTEGPGFNVFAVSRGALVAPDTGVLEGVTRQTVLEIAAEIGLPAEVRRLPVGEFLNAQEIFTATTAGGIAPVTRVNDRRFGDGTPGRRTRELMAKFDEWRMRPEHRTPVSAPAGSPADIPAAAPEGDGLTQAPAS